jgi:hypothetical protein
MVDSAAKQVPRFFVAGPIFAGFLAAAYRVLTITGHKHRRHPSQMRQLNDVELCRTPLSSCPKRNLGSLDCLSDIKTNVFSAIRSEFIAHEHLNRAKHAVHDHYF